MVDAGCALYEEHAVSLTPDHRNLVARRVWRLRLESEARLSGRPRDCRARLEERALESLGCVANLGGRENAAPFDLEGDGREHWEHRWDRWVGEPQATGKSQPGCQRVRKVVIIEDVQTAHAQPRPTLVDVDLHGMVTHADGPKQAVGLDVRVVVVYLLGEVGRSNWTGEEVESNKGECALVPTPIGPDEHALIEAHVRLKREWLRLPCDGVGTDAAAQDACDTHEPSEVRHL